MVSPQGAPCPHCGQRAPLVLRGVEARCTVCGGFRLPFSAKALNLAGKPSRIGGFAAKVAGVSVLILGAVLALGLGLLAQTLVPGGYLGLAIALPIAILTLAIGLTLVLGGRKLSMSGDAAALTAKKEAVRALASHRRGDLTAASTARALQLGEADADALLTTMARDPEEEISLDVDDDGVVHYLFGPAAEARRFESLGQRIEPEPWSADDAAREEAALDEAARAEQLRRRR